MFLGMATSQVSDPETSRDWCKRTRCGRKRPPVSIPAGPTVFAFCLWFAALVLLRASPTLGGCYLAVDLF